MNIWYVSKYAGIPNKNAATRHYYLSKNLSEQYNSLNICLVTSRSNGKSIKKFNGLYKRKVDGKLEINIINGPNIKLGFNYKRLFSWVIFEVLFLVFALSRKKKNRPNIVIASSLSILTFISAAIIKKCFKCKLIIEVRDIWPDSIIELGFLSSKNIFIKILKKVEKLGYSCADGFISPLSKFDDYLAEKYLIHKPFLYIPQGYDEAWLEAKEVPDIFDHKMFNVCYAGSIGKANYIDLIIASAKFLINYNICIYIIGDGPLKLHYQEVAKSYTNIFFIESIPKNELISLLSYSDLLIHMLNDYEIYQYGISPNKWVDYMLSGTPILLTNNRTDILLKEANCGLYLGTPNPETFASKIYEISKIDKQVLRQLGANGRSYAINRLNYVELSKKLKSFLNTM